MHPQSTAPESATHAPDGQPCEGSAPGSPQWYATMSASKVAAVIGVSDWDSPRSLWNKMAGLDWVPDDGDDTTRRGHYLEDGIRRWFADQHPDLTITGGHEWESIEYPWAHATPDGHAFGDAPMALVEIKTSTKPDEWGQPGTDEVPTGYYWQCQWQMFVTGCERVHVDMLGAFLEFAEYVVERSEADIEWLLQQCQQFVASLPGHRTPEGTPPPVDGHRETLPSVQRVYGAPEGDKPYEVAEHLATEYLASFHGVQAAEARKREATAVLLDVARDAKRLVVGEQTIATVSVTKAGAASVRPNPTAVKAFRPRSVALESRF
jgi:putative phage-type endonuclease